jgi:hypothetical protein
VGHKETLGRGRLEIMLCEGVSQEARKSQWLGEMQLYPHLGLHQPPSLIWWKKPSVPFSLLFWAVLT